MTRRRRTAHERLQRAREYLARARASSADPWRIEELRLRYEDALAAAMADPDEPVSDDAPSPRRRADPVPLAWVDESGRRRGGP